MGVLTILARIATGVLKGYDALMNLVLDEVEELLRGESGGGGGGLRSPARCGVVRCGADFLADDEGNEMTRPLGLVVVRGTLLVVVSPVDGSEVIANPFLQGDDE